MLGLKRMSEEKFDDAFFTWFGVCAIPAVLALLFLGGEPWWERATGLDPASSMAIVFFLGVSVVWVCGRVLDRLKGRKTTELTVTDEPAQRSNQ